jgi:hypothetical protein
LALAACGSREFVAPRYAAVAFELPPTVPAAPFAAAAPPAAPPAVTPAATSEVPTWTAIYARYLGPSTEGGCGRAQACHADAMPDAPAAYEWLAQRGYIAGPESPLVRSNSCLRWFGGNMPPRGKANDAAARDLAAWANAGAANN